ncbi:MAG: subclass B3 metallo-beta-lactamase [Terriglobales bacterium]
MKSTLLVVVLLSSILSFAQSDPTWRSWNQPVEPFRIVGNIYYVGASDIASYLITSPQGHILLDGGFVETAPMIRDNIRKLGFKVEDVKVLLNSHAHFDHAAGLAQLKQWTGAKFVASRADGDQIARGGHDDPMWGDKLLFPPTRPDRFISDGETVSVGDTVITAHLTPGHTRGCTTWTTGAVEGGQRYHVLFLCSVSAPGYKLVNNPKYPNIVEDYRHTFTYLKTLPCDVFLAAHASFFHMAEKRAEQKRDPGHNTFIDPEEFRKFIDDSEREFEAQLQKQKATK